MIQVFVIAMIALLAVTKATLHGRLSRRAVFNMADGIFMNSVIFAAAMVTFIVISIFNGETVPSRDTILFGLIGGVTSIIFQISYINAMKTGKMALTVMCSNFSMLIPTFLSVYIFNEPMNWLKIAGLILVVVSFVVITEKDGDSDVKTSAKWYFFMALTFLSNAAFTVAQKIYGKWYYTDENQFGYVALIYTFATVLSVLVILIMGTRGVKFNHQRMLAPKNLLTAAFIGLILGVFQCFNTLGAKLIDGSILYPVSNGGITVLMTISGAVIFREKLSKRQLIGCVIGILAIVSMSMA